MNMYTLKTVEEIVETFVKEDAPKWVKDYVRNFVKNYYFVEEETAVNDEMVLSANRAQSDS